MSGTRVVFEQPGNSATPDAGMISLYPKVDGKFYTKNDAGTETQIGSGGGSGLAMKAGFIAGGTFAGTPKKATVTFATAFVDANYSIHITGTDGRTYTYESKTAAGFDINANANAAISGQVSWQAIYQGET